MFPVGKRNELRDRVSRILRKDGQCTTTEANCGAARGTECMQLKHRARTLRQRRQRCRWPIHTAAIADAIPVRARLLDDFAHFRKHRHGVRWEEFRDRLHTRASLRVTERRLKRNSDQFDFIHLAIGRLRAEIDFEDALDLVAEEIESHRRSAAWRIDVDDSSAHRNFARRFDCIDAAISTIDEPCDEFCGFDARTDGQTSNELRKPRSFRHRLHQCCDRRDDRARAIAFRKPTHECQSRDGEFRARTRFAGKNLKRGEKRRFHTECAQFLYCIVGLVEMRDDVHDGRRRVGRRVCRRVGRSVGRSRLTRRGKQRCDDRWQPARGTFERGCASTLAGFSKCIADVCAYWLEHRRCG